MIGGAGAEATHEEPPACAGFVLVSALCTTIECVTCWFHDYLERWVLFCVVPLWIYCALFAI